MRTPPSYMKFAVFETLESVWIFPRSTSKQEIETDPHLMDQGLVLKPADKSTEAVLLWEKNTVEADKPPDKFKRTSRP